MQRNVSALILRLILPTLLAAPVAAEVDKSTGLIKDDNWQLISQNCAACHSLKLVTANRFDRETWLETIRWMQKTQKLWEFKPAVEDKILTYLATNYAPSARVRRPALAPDLMPK